RTDPAGEFHGAELEPAQVSMNLKQYLLTNILLCPVRVRSDDASGEPLDERSIAFDQLAPGKLITALCRFHSSLIEFVRALSLRLVTLTFRFFAHARSPSCAASKRPLGEKVGLEQHGSARASARAASSSLRRDGSHARAPFMRSRPLVA